ncbi:MAG: hypothetical protein Q4G04_03450 [bacterium]|nr:hypothetical protein [bacterium]
MRIRNNKINVFLNDDEKNILKRNSSKLNLSQSEYIRNLIVGYEIKIPVVNEEKTKKQDIDIENIIRVLEENIDYLTRAKNRFHYLGYFEDEKTLLVRIETLNVLKSNIKKNNIC